MSVLLVLLKLQSASVELSGHFVNKLHQDIPHLPRRKQIALVDFLDVYLDLLINIKLARICKVDPSDIITLSGRANKAILLSLDLLIPLTIVLAQPRSFKFQVRVCVEIISERLKGIVH